MTEITLTAGEVAQLHLRLFRIQKASKEGRQTYIFNQARLLQLLVQKAERRELKARRNTDRP